MVFETYGVWVARAKSFTAEGADIDPSSPHIHLKFADGLNSSSSAPYTAAINVKSQSIESRLVYWLIRDFRHPITHKLADLDFGFRLIPESERKVEGLALDYIRGNLLQNRDGKLLPHDVPGPDNDIIDSLEPILTSAIDRKATIYLFGSQFSPRKDGIHEVHMNQGSLPRFPNGVWSDGGLILRFSDDGHWEAIFLAFASQAIHTDDINGKPLPGSLTFAEYLEPGDGNVGDGIGSSGGGGGFTGKEDAAVAILAAMVNPTGNENQPTSTGQRETVYLINRTDKTVPLTGWRILNTRDMSQSLPENTELEVKQVKAVEVPAAPLSNKGGKISLLDGKGWKVDGVSYTSEQARKEGEVIYFRESDVPLPRL
ncbi:DUF2278 family protein [Lipomyces tetrasporus]